MNEEQMAYAMHWAWSQWTKYMLSQCRIGENGTLVIPQHLVLRWRRQMVTPYGNLSEPEKESDRKIAREILKIVCEA